MQRLRTLLIGLFIVLVAVFVVFAATGCSADEPQAQKNEGKIRQQSYQRLAAAQPAHQMEYSPSRNTINFWIDTWGRQPNKLAYVYLLASNGQMIGYYVFKGLPVSYCAALTPTYQFIPVDGDGTDQKYQVPAPGVDGVYYSGGQCSAYYGIDATTNSYLEYTVGQGISALIYERPLPRQDVEPLGFTTIGVKK